MMRLDLLPKIRGEFFNLIEEEFSAIKAAKTSSELVHEEKRFNFKLVRYSYGSGIDKENQEKVLLVPHVINRPYTLDFNDDVSVVRRLCERDFDVYLIDGWYRTIEYLSFSQKDQGFFVNPMIRKFFLPRLRRQLSLFTLQHA